MVTMFVVMETYFNGEGDSQRPVKVFSSEAKAEAFAKARNDDEKAHPYSPDYEVVEVDFEE